MTLHTIKGMLKPSSTAGWIGYGRPGVIVECAKNGLLRDWTQVLDARILVVDDVGDIASHGRWWSRYKDETISGNRSAGLILSDLIVLCSSSR